MSEIHYFQRYSQPENVVTNNTLLLFSRLYHLAPRKFSEFLNELLQGPDMQTGIQFSQQVVGIGSVTDGVIAQESFKIVIETKLHDKFSVSQLTAHMASFGSEQHQFLLALSPIPIETSRRTEVEAHILDRGGAIRLICTTFGLVIQSFRNALNEYDLELHELINDYESYCSQANLLDQSASMLRIVPCGWTLELNVKHGIYFAPASRGYTKHNYLGLYKGKRVQQIGQIQNIITANLTESGELVVIEKLNDVSSQQSRNIVNCITETKIQTNWSIDSGHTFFCVDAFYETNYIKTSKHGMLGTRLINLKEALGSEPASASAVATQLEGKTWPKP